MHPPNANISGSTKNRSYQLPNNANGQVETKTAMDAKNQIK